MNQAYLYYPGCSLEGTALEYDLSCRALFKALDRDLIDVADWTCCGATAAEAVDHLLSYALPARNLALAEKMESGRELLVPCSACYLNLKRAREALRTDPDITARVNRVLEEDGLAAVGSVRVRHLLDVLSRDVPVAEITDRAARRMKGLIIAPYYGCQCLRPFKGVDDPEQPSSMDALIRATGATPLAWDLGATCCGASSAAIKPAVGQALTGRILDGAAGAHAVVTVCPMCQMNLERFQARPMPVMYLPQFLGLAMGLSPEEMGCHLNLSDNHAVLTRIAP